MQSRLLKKYKPIKIKCYAKSDSRILYFDSIEDMINKMGFKADVIFAAIQNPEIKVRGYILGIKI